MGCREYRRICGKRRVWAPVLIFALLWYNVNYHPFAAQVGAGAPASQPPVSSPGTLSSIGLGAPATAAVPPKPTAPTTPTTTPTPTPPATAVPPPPPPAAEVPPTPPQPPSPTGGTVAPLTQELMSAMSEVEKRAYATSINTAQEVFNSEKLPVPLGDAPIIVVMVHNRPKYFEAVLRSLEQARGIESALLVVSLDYLSPEMDAIVRGIKFCAVVQIFCTASQQLFPAAYPGTDPKDCAGGWDSLKKPQAKASGCINWETPDQYGHYREAKFVAVKHHWFWQFNFLFQKLTVAAEGQWSGYAFYMEEDNYVAPDTLSVLGQMTQIAQTQCGEDKCGLLNLGLKVKEAISDNGQGFETRGHTLSVAGWESPKHNMGMAFNRHFWQKMQACADTFCQHDDYNWDWTTEAVLASCANFGGKTGALVLGGARVYHFGSCGVHVGAGQDCEGAEPDTSAIEAMLGNVKEQLFPRSLEFRDGGVRPGRGPVNGGWGDARDHKLCSAFGRGEALLEYTPGFITV